MNRQHFRAFVWLRWRLRMNQLRRGGTANVVLLTILAVLGLLLALTLFVVALLVGIYAMAESPPAVVLFVWDGLVVAFLFCWAIGVINDLQRSEALSLDKFLHLPVSLSGAFIINYLTSLISFNLVIFLPPMLGLALALAIALGPHMLLVFPLLAAFLLMVTALTYQFQGWLASLMVNPRRRRTVIVVVTAIFILIAQLPQLINIVRPWRNSGQPSEAATQLYKDQTELRRLLDGKEITQQQFEERNKKLTADFWAQREEQKRELLGYVDHVAWYINLALPPGWLPLGARDLAAGNPLAAILGTLGLTLIGAASLRRAYRTSIRFYTGQFTAGTAAAKGGTLPSPPIATGGLSANSLERRLPWLSESAAVITLGSFRSLLRAPEAKMMLLSPILMLVVFGSMFLTRTSEVIEPARPLLPFGAMAMTLFSMVQLIGNQFGFDRAGFRVFVLSPAPRRDILLGKNLALAPLAFGLGLLCVLVLEVLYPLRFDHLLAVVPQFISMFVIFCMIANCLSILAPMPIAPGSFRPVQAKAVPILLNVSFIFVFPILIAPTLLPLGLEVVLHQQTWAEPVPICLILALVECAGLVLLYHFMVGWQGAWLQAREQRILEVVTAKAE